MKSINIRCINSTSLSISSSVSLIKYKNLRLVEAKIPNSYYSLNSYNNEVLITNDITHNDETLYLGSGSFSTVSAFTSTLQTALNTNTLGLTFTVSYNSVTYLMTISADFDFSIDFDSPLLMEMLGFTANLTGSDTYTGTKIIDIDIYDEFLISFDFNGINSFQNFYVDSSVNLQRSLILFNTVPFGSYNYYDMKDDNIYLFKDEPSKQFNTFKATVTFRDGNLIDFNGQSLMFVFEIED